jgi:hypothetical protein
LYGVVSTHFPRIYGVLLHPSQKEREAFDNAARPEDVFRVVRTRIDTLPTNVLEEYDSRAVAAYVLTFAVRIVITATFAVCFIAAGAVFGNGGRTKHHNIVFTAAGGVAFAVGPSVFSIPRVAAAAPTAGEVVCSVERGQTGVIAVYTIGILIQVFRFVIAGYRFMLGFHQGL